MSRDVARARRARSSTFPIRNSSAKGAVLVGPDALPGTMIECKGATMGERTVGIIQARMLSNRLPGKVLLDLGTKPVLKWVVDCCLQVPNLDEVVVAIPESKEDDVLADFCSRTLGLRIFRGSELDVLDRYYQAALASRADIIVRITADDPFKDPQMVARLIDDLRDRELDYANNFLQGGCPEGLDVEVLRFDALAVAASEAILESDREHVTPFFWRHPERFLIGSTVISPKGDGIRLTLDTMDDYIYLSEIAQVIGRQSSSPSWPSLFQLLHENRDLSRRQPRVERFAGYHEQRRVEGTNCETSG